MNKILVYTDFSENGFDAVCYAYEMSRDLDLPLLITHYVWVKQPIGGMTSIAQRAQTDAVEEMFNTVQRLKEAYKGHDFSKLEINVGRGDLIKSLNKAVKRNKSRFVVIGSRGEFENSEIFLGSISGSIIWQSDIPSLVIPKSYKYKSIEKTLLAIRSPRIAGKSTIKPLKVINDIIGDIKLEILVVNDNEEQSLGEYLSALDASHEKVRSKELYRVSQEYSEKKDIDLLTVVRRKRGFFSNFILNTQMSANKWSVNKPMLVLHGVKEN